MNPERERQQRVARGILIAGGLFVLVTAVLGAARPVGLTAGHLAEELGLPDFFEHDTAEGPAVDPAGPGSGGTGAPPGGSGGPGPVVPVASPAPPFPQLAQVLDFERMVEKRPGRVPVEVHGVYLTGYTAGKTDTVDRMVRELRGTQFNTFVIDVKNDAGRISYRSDVPLAMQVGASTKWIDDPEPLLTKLRAEGIYTIARIVVFKDPVLTRKRPDLAIHDLSGNPWHDRTGAGWLNPYSHETWDYTLALAQEAAVKGFQEIQFDYVRFPSDGETSQIAYGEPNGGKADTIADFLKYAHEKLQPYDVYLSADIFGLVGTVTDDMGIGQKLEKILGTVDYISPMVYPSHYGARNFGLEDPESRPYETVFASLQDYRRRMTAADSKTGLRPWLQDFSLRVHYGQAEVAGQIKAARDLGVREFILWNPANVYNLGVFKEGREANGEAR